MKLFIGFSKPKKKFVPFSWLIRLFYGGVGYSHVMVFWYDDYIESPVYYEASGHELKFLSPEAFSERAELLEVWSRELPPDKEQPLTKYCMARAGVEYGGWQVVGIFLAKLLGLKRNPFSRGPGEQVCSELVIRILRSLYNENMHLNPDLAGPPDLRSYFKQNSNFHCEWSRIIK